MEDIPQQGPPQTTDYAPTRTACEPRHPPTASCVPQGTAPWSPALASSSPEALDEARPEEGPNQPTQGRAGRPGLQVQALALATHPGDWAGGQHESGRPKQRLSQNGEVVHALSHDDHAAATTSTVTCQSNHDHHGKDSMAKLTGGVECKVIVTPS